MGRYSRRDYMQLHNTSRLFSGGRPSHPARWNGLVEVVLEVGSAKGGSKDDRRRTVRGLPTKEVPSGERSTSRVDPMARE